MAGQLARTRSAMLKSECDICEEADAVIQVSTTDMDGVVLDSGNYCADCITELRVASNGNLTG